MVRRRGGKKAASSKKTLEEKEAAENVLAEAQVSGLLADRDAQLEDGIHLVTDETRNENFEEMPGEEGDKVPIIDKEGPSMPATNLNGESIKEEFEENIFEADKIDDQEDMLFENEEEHFEHNNEERVLDEYDVSEEDASDEDDGDSELSGEATTEEDEVSEEEATKEENDGENNQEEKENAKKDTWEAPKDGGEAKKHGKEKLEACLKNNNKYSGRSIKKMAQASRLKKVDSQDEPKSSRKKKVMKRVESMGMIFMCNAETKKDCYQYMVLGLPKSKKDIVKKIYNGMRIFLYDINLRLLYGIYRAVSRGGYNIEPKAFKRKFPSQVRFEIMDDCLPLTEEKFKTVIKANNITKSRSRFDLKLNSEQVKKLCRLFYATSKGRPSKRLGKSLEAEKQPIHQEKNRRRIRGDKKRLPLREDARHQERPHKRQRKVISLAAVPRQHLPAPVPITVPSSYAYDSAFDVDAYRQECHSPYRDRRDRPIIPLDPYGGLQDPPIERSERYRDGRDPPLERDHAYRIVRDSHIDWHDPYIDGVASFSRRRDLDPYRVGRDPYLESPHLYRNVQELYTQRRDPYRDGRALYLERRVLSGDGVHSDPYSTYRSHPLSDSSNVYRYDLGVELRGSYRWDELLRHRVLHPLDLETRNSHDVPSSEVYLSNRERPSYVAPLYPSLYPSRAYVYRL